MKKEDAIYIAAFIDGEGTISVNKNTHRRSYGEYETYNPFIQIVNSDRKVLEYIAETTGFGQVVEFLAHKRKANWKRYWRLSIYSSKAVELCATLLPYLRVKHKQAELIANWPWKEFRATTGSRGGRAIDKRTQLRRRQITAKIRKLNKRGV